jgi:hypothetical protein
MNTTTFNETASKTKTRRRKMEKDGNNLEKEEHKPRQKDHRMKRQFLHNPRSKEIDQKQ